MPGYKNGTTSYIYIYMYICIYVYANIWELPPSPYNQAMTSRKNLVSIL